MGESEWSMKPRNLYVEASRARLRLHVFAKSGVELPGRGLRGRAPRCPYLLNHNAPLLCIARNSQGATGRASDQTPSPPLRASRSRFASVASFEYRV